MKRLLIIFLALFALTNPASAAYNYMQDVLIGNTVEIADMITGGKVRLFHRADNTTIRLIPGKPNEAGVWRETKKDLCSTFPSDGKEYCSAKPKKIKVPMTKTMKGTLPGGAKFHVVFTWMAGEVRFED
jgi:hypothetical protein